MTFAHGSPDLEPDSLPGELVRVPQSVPELRVLRGWVGRSAYAEKVRVYLTPSLDTWVEVAGADVVHRLRAPLGGGLGGSLVWVRADAELATGQTDSAEAAGELGEDAIRDTPRCWITWRETPWWPAKPPETQWCPKAAREEDSQRC